METATLKRYARHLRNPVYFARRVHYKIYELLHPDEPWLAQGAIRFCDTHLTADMRGLEWGSGRSTQWFAKKLAHLMSIEHHEEWYHKVKAVLQAKNMKNVDYRHIPLDHPVETPNVPRYDPLPAYVAVANQFSDDALDLVIVDGHYRQACILASLPKIRPGGYLLVDNTNWLPLHEWGVPPHWPIVHQSSNVMTQTTIWQKPKA